MGSPRGRKQQRGGGVVGGEAHADRSCYECVCTEKNPVLHIRMYKKKKKSGRPSHLRPSQREARTRRVRTAAAPLAGGRRADVRVTHRVATVQPRQQRGPAQAPRWLATRQLGTALGPQATMAAAIAAYMGTRQLSGPMEGDNVPPPPGHPTSRKKKPDYLFFPTMTALRVCEGKAYPRATLHHVALTHPHTGILLRGDSDSPVHWTSSLAPLPPPSCAVTPTAVG